MSPFEHRRDLSKPCLFTSQWKLVHHHYPNITLIKFMWLLWWPLSCHVIPNLFKWKLKLHFFSINASPTISALTLSLGTIKLRDVVSKTFTYEVTKTRFLVELECNTTSVDQCRPEMSRMSCVWVELLTFVRLCTYHTVLIIIIFYYLFSFLF